MTSCSLVFASPRLGPGLQRRAHRFKESRARPPDKARRRCRAIRRATSAGMPARPHRGARLWPSPRLGRPGPPGRCRPCSGPPQPSRAAVSSPAQGERIPGHERGDTGTHRWDTPALSPRESALAASRWSPRAFQGAARRWSPAASRRRDPGGRSRKTSHRGATPGSSTAPMSAGTSPPAVACGSQTGPGSTNGYPYLARFLCQHALDLNLLSHGKPRWCEGWQMLTTLLQYQ